MFETGDWLSTIQEDNLSCAGSNLLVDRVRSHETDRCKNVVQLRSCCAERMLLTADQLVAHAWTRESEKRKTDARR